MTERESKAAIASRVRSSDPVGRVSSDGVFVFSSMTAKADPNASTHAEPSNDGDPQVSGSTMSRISRLSPRQLRLSRRRRNVLLICLAGCLTVIGVLWSQGFFEVSQEPSEPAVPAEILLDRLCDQIEEAQGDTLHVDDFEVQNALMSRIRKMESIETLILDQGSLTDESMEIIAGLPKLQHLRLRMSPIGDDGMKQLSKIETLWYLNLPHAVCTAEGVEALSSIPRLRQLRLGSKNLGNEVTRAIASIESLRGVHLIGVAVTDEGLKTLAEMPYLESLYLDDSAVTEAGWEWLFREHPYLHVHIDQKHHDRDPKAHQHRN